jgi:hypothetical protein
VNFSLLRGHAVRSVFLLLSTLMEDDRLPPISFKREFLTACEHFYIFILKHVYWLKPVLMEDESPSY